MKKVLRIVTNKFFLVSVVFVAWMSYFDSNDWWTMHQRKKELQSVKDNISYLNVEIGQMEKEYNGLATDPKTLERYAREHYRMKRDNEDVYIIEKK